MNQDFLLAYESRCIQEEAPACQSACPFHLDVRSFMSHMEEGFFKDAKKVLERFLPLTEILGRLCDAPCEKHCLREARGGFIKISTLERACLNLVPDKAKPLPRPAKEAKIAIVGFGLAALTAASELSLKGYRPVCYWGTENNLAEQLLYMLENKYHKSNLKEVLPVDILAAEIDGILNKIDLAGERPNKHLINQLSTDYQSIMLDASGLDLEFNVKDISPMTAAIADDYRILYGGFSGLVSFDIAQGKTAAVSMERFVSGTSVSAYRMLMDSEPCKLYTPLDDVSEIASSLAQNDITEAGLQAEARRCLKCQCLDCVRHCAYLEHYSAYPKKYARQMFLNVTMVKGQHLANPLINSCALCGQCEAICKGKFSMENFTLEARRGMVENAHMPPPAHEFALEDMLDSNADGKRLFIAAEKNTRYLFFPGCQLAASRPEQVYELYEHLNKSLNGECGFALACCAAPAHWAGRQAMFEKEMASFKNQWLELGKPHLIVACASCWKIFSQYLTEMPMSSLWEFLAHQAPLSPASIKPDGSFFIHDPCSARYNSQWHDSVRQLLYGAGVNYSETKTSKERSGCCGYGGLVWNAHPDIADKILHKMAQPLNGNAIVSCIMCRDRLVELGYRAWHILDFLLPGADNTGACEKGPGLSARRYGRLNLRKRFLRQDISHDCDDQIIISASLLAELEKHFILRQDVEEVVAYAESGGQCFHEEGSNIFLAMHKPRNVSFWVEYSKDAGRIIVHDAYCHRMVVPMADLCRKESANE